MRTATSSTSSTVGDPATGLPIGRAATNLKAAIAGETHEYTDMYPGMAKAARERRLRRDRRLVRDARQGRALARQPLPEGARRAGRLTRAIGGDRATRRPRAPGASMASTSAIDAMREGNLEAPTRHPHRLAEPGVLRRGGARQGAGARLRHLPRLPPLRQPVQRVPDAVRPGRREHDAARSTASTRRTTGRSSTSATCATCAT